MVKRHQSVIVVIAVVADFLKEFFHVTFKHFSKVFLVLYIHIYIYETKIIPFFFTNVMKIKHIQYLIIQEIFNTVYIFDTVLLFSVIILYATLLYAML